MKKTYTRYKHGELEKVEEKLVLNDKKVLKEFLKKSSITAGDKKVNQIKKIVLQLQDVTQTSLTKQTKETIDNFLVLLNKSDRSMWTKNEIKIYLKQFLLWLYKNPSLVENFKTDNRRELNPQKITESNLINEKDVEKMLRYAKSYKDKAYLLLAFQTGARPQELSLLQWKDVKFEKDYTNITLFSRKTKQSRAFPIVKKTKDALWEWKQHYTYPDVSFNDYVFVGVRRGKPMSSAGLNKILRRMAKGAGLNKDCWNYLLRHSRATKLYEELPQQIVEKLMGHKDMAGIYAHISSKKAREVMLKKIYKIDELPSKREDKLEQEIINLKKKYNAILKKNQHSIMQMKEIQEKYERLFQGKDFMKLLRALALKQQENQN